MGRRFDHEGDGWQVTDFARGFTLFGPDTFDACWSYVAERCGVRRDLLEWDEGSGAGAWTIYAPDKLTNTGFAFLVPRQRQEQPDGG